MISTKCPHCGTAIQVPDEFAGRFGSCKTCGKGFAVPKLPPDPNSFASHAKRGAGMGCGCFIMVALLLFAVLCFIVILPSLIRASEAAQNAGQPPTSAPIIRPMERK